LLQQFFSIHPANYDIIVDAGVTPGFLPEHHNNAYLPLANSIASTAHINTMDISSESPSSSLSDETGLEAIERHIDTITNKPRITRFSQYNLEPRTIAATDLYLCGYYKTIATAARAFECPYKRVYGRVNGRKPLSSNGGRNTILSEEQEGAVLMWAHRQIICGHHVRARRLRHHVNALLLLSGSTRTVSKRWAQTWMKRHRNIFHQRRTITQEASRKAVEDRAIITRWFDAWNSFLRSHNIKKENIWNFDETGFMVGFIEHGSLVWTFHDITQPVTLNPGDRVSVTAVEAINAAGGTIPSFLILPGVQIPRKWVENDLEDDTVLTTNENGYMTDRLAIEWIEHFERCSRPANKDEKRVLVMDNCDSHYTEEFAAFAALHNIEIFPLPPKLTHLLQPLDVGVFSPYKHWHQEVLIREAAISSYSFNKADFLYHLHEIRTRTFKQGTIKRAWELSGLCPCKPELILDALPDALSSLTQKTQERDLAGYISTGEDNNADHDLYQQPQTPHQITPQRQFSSLSQPTTPPTIRRFNWSSVRTPEMNVMKIREYNDYVALRLEVSINSNVPITPSVRHVHQKARKASEALELNGITASNELRAVHEKALNRRRYEAHTSVIARYGPIRAGDARLRAAKDDANREAAQKEEAIRIQKRSIAHEAMYARRWIGQARKSLRYSIKRMTFRDTMIYSRSEGTARKWFTKGDIYAALKADALMAMKYACIRELQQRPAMKTTTFVIAMPIDYNEGIIYEAVQYITDRAVVQEIRRKEKQLQVELFSQASDNNSSNYEDAFEDLVDEEEPHYYTE
jgi:hypothetical protein